MRNVEIRHLRYFVAVAEELSFSKAAVRLHMSQPPLSQQIKILEENMGVQLLERSRRHVHLTEAGRVFLAESKNILNNLKHAVGRTVRTASVASGQIRVGFVTTALFHALPIVQARIATSFPDLTLVVYDLSTRNQIDRLIQGHLDIGIVHSCSAPSEINKVLIFTEPFVLAVPKGHELDSDITLTAEIIEKHPIIGFSNEQSPSLYDAQLACCLAKGFRPNLVHSARTPFAIFQLIRLGFGISLVPRFYATSGVSGIVFRELDGSTGNLHLHAVWNENNYSELTDAIVECLLSNPGSISNLSD